MKTHVVGPLNYASYKRNEILYSKHEKQQIAKDKAKIDKFSAFCFWSVVALALSAFCLSIALVKERQQISVISHGIVELEKKLATLDAKNTELDAKILNLSSPEALRALIESGNLVSANRNNTVKISKTKANF